MIQIVANINTFCLKQNVTVYQDGICIDVAQPTIEEMPNVIKAFSSKYETNEIDIAGSKQYALKIKEKLGTNFNLCPINIIYEE